MSIELVVLNYNGESLLAECLGSVVRAAAASRHDCRVVVIDNDSSDTSIEWLKQEFPDIEVVRRRNDGLCSYNAMLAGRHCDVAVLLNNDIKLAVDSVDPLVAPLVGTTRDADCFMTAPQCRQFDGGTYEGFRTAIGWRMGLVQATALFPGHERHVNQPGLTASAGAAMAVDRERFLSLGGFDPLYLPGRLEDLDFCFRGYQAGFHARYVPEAVIEHRGAATFGEVFGAAGCHRLALRNTLLFQWKNLRHPVHIARVWTGLSIRMVYDVVRSPFQRMADRFALARALGEAWRRWRSVERDGAYQPVRSRTREFCYFRQFSFRRMATLAASRACSNTAMTRESTTPPRRDIRPIAPNEKAAMEVAASVR